MFAALLLLLAAPARAGVVRAPAAPSRPAVCAAAPAPVPMPPSYLSVADPADAVRLSAVLRAAQASPTAVAVLARVAEAAEARGRPVVVEVVKMKESGTYNLDWDVLSLRRRDLRGSPRANVSTLIHELQHLLQTRAPVPSDLLETELEAYVVDFRVSRELGEKPRRGSYDARAEAAFKKGLEPFLRFLREEYPEDAQLHGTKSRDYENRLRRGLESSAKKLERLQGERAARLRVLEQMRGLGQREADLENYRQDAISPLDAAIATADRAIGWARKDLALLADPATRAAARAYARSVVRRARAFQKIFARD